MKEKAYQQQFQNTIEIESSSFAGKSCRVFCEDFSTEHDSILQECSPFIGGKAGDNSYEYLKADYGIVGLREKIKEFNEAELSKYILMHKLSISLEDALEAVYQDFIRRFHRAKGKAEDQYGLIFTANEYLPTDVSRQCHFAGVKTPFSYRVVHYEDATAAYTGKNAFYTIRERRIPIPNQPVNRPQNINAHAQSERPDFVHYINGIPLFIVEMKTENSGIISSLKDFVHKETYDLAPFKVALNDGRDALLFADVRALKFSDNKDNSFKWVHYLKEKRSLKGRSYSNMDYLLHELFCQPENMYAYCVYGCSVISPSDKTSERYLINARIQQYFAIKSVLRSLKSISSGQKALPYNFIFEHAQRSGKTITMKFITYAIENQFKGLFNTLFFYTPDLQIKKVITKEMTQSGNKKVMLKVIESRREFEKVIASLNQEERSGTLNGRAAFHVYVVNMQKFETQDTYTSNPFASLGYQPVQSTKVLNFIDEAHHGQTQATAVQRSLIFPNASNYLFTATPKEGTYAYYFGDASRADHCDRFTISHAKACNITVPVYYLTAEKSIFSSPKLTQFSQEIERMLRSNNKAQSEAFFGGDESEDSSKSVLEERQKSLAAKEIERRLKVDLYPEKLKYICAFLDGVRIGLPFSPKTIVYVKDIESAKGYIQYIQSLPDGQNNLFQGYRFGTDFSNLLGDCATYNPGIEKPVDVSSNFEKTRDPKDYNDKIIDVLFAVDKYQKGFDLPTLIATFLDTNIQEPSVINQIYTRSATKHTGKECGYCVDLTFAGEEGNLKTHQRSLSIYDREDVQDSFLDHHHLETLKKTVDDAIASMRQAFAVATGSWMTSNTILNVVLNEPDAVLREQHQSLFFRQSRRVFQSLRDAGTPLGFSPLSPDLMAILNAFKSFKQIYADRHHPEHEKISINLDASADRTQIISQEEIKSIINEALHVMNLGHIKELIKISYADFSGTTLSDVKQVEFQAQLKREVKKQEVEKAYFDYKAVIHQCNTSLAERLKRLLERINGNRLLINEEEVQEELTQLSMDLDALKETIRQQVRAEHSGNPADFWTYQLILEKMQNPNGITFLPNEVESLKPFVRFIAKEIGLNVSNAISQTADHIDATQKSNEALVRLFEMHSFVSCPQTSAFLMDFKNSLTEEADALFMKSLVEINARIKIDSFPYYSCDLEEFKAFMKQVIHKTVVVA